MKFEKILRKIRFALITVLMGACIYGLMILPAGQMKVYAYDLAGEVKNVKPELSIYVNTAQNCVTIYMVGDNGEEIPIKAMACSCGRAGHATPKGTFKVQERYTWRLMVDNTWAQYAVRFNKHILFHSVPYVREDPSTLEADQYNLLGQPASLGCVRLCVEDAKWIYDNVKQGTKVTVYEDASDPGPLGKPERAKIDVNDAKSGWDPTDPDPKNPW